MKTSLIAAATFSAMLFGGGPADAQGLDPRSPDHGVKPAPRAALQRTTATPDQARALLIAVLLVGSASVSAH